MMNSYLVASVAFLCIFGGALIGMLIQRFIPAHHLSKDSHESVKLGAGLIATMAALILGLLVSSSKGTYDRVNVLINDAAANTISLDRTLRNFGPEAAPLRKLLLDRIIIVRNDVWPEDNKVLNKGSAVFKQESTIISLIKDIASLNASDLGSIQMKNNALSIASDLNKERWQITVESSSKLPLLLVVIPVFWITFLTFVYGIFAPRNGTVLAVLFFCSVSIAGAIFLICEMSMPLDGSIKVPSQPFQTALELISR
ncbi:MAG: hypothetical protein K8R57_03040 [Verrucomicrobia bacterium]|nr:hypothetical protein [Verrucomicrobiota bacterium]